MNYIIPLQFFKSAFKLLKFGKNGFQYTPYFCMCVTNCTWIYLQFAGTKSKPYQFYLKTKTKSQVIVLFCFVFLFWLFVCMFVCFCLYFFFLRLSALLLFWTRSLPRRGVAYKMVEIAKHLILFILSVKICRTLWYRLDQFTFLTVDCTLNITFLSVSVRSK